MNFNFQVVFDNISYEYKYGVVNVKIRFQTSLAEQPFYMDKKVFNSLLQNDDFRNNLGDKISELLKYNKDKIIEKIEKHTIDSYEKNCINFLNRGQGFTICFKFVSLTDKDINDLVNKFKEKKITNI